MKRINRVSVESVERIHQNTPKTVLVKSCKRASCSSMIIYTSIVSTLHSKISYIFAVRHRIQTLGRESVQSLLLLYYESARRKRRAGELSFWCISESETAPHTSKIEPCGHHHAVNCSKYAHDSHDELRRLSSGEFSDNIIESWVRMLEMIGYLRSTRL